MVYIYTNNKTKQNKTTYNVVAGPNAANCCADVIPARLVDDKPMKDVSTNDNNGPATHNAKQGRAN
jgi:hypothetical protein